MTNSYKNESFIKRMWNKLYVTTKKIDAPLEYTQKEVCQKSDEILSYTDKYIGDGKSKGGTIGGKGVPVKTGAKAGGAKGGNSQFSNKKIPAEISKEKSEEIQNLAKEVFKILGCSSVARVDFLIDQKDDNKVYVNEINTIPGALSYYLWEASGKTFEQELDEIIELAIKRQRDREKLTFSYDQNILAMQGGSKGSKWMKK